MTDRLSNSAPRNRRSLPRPVRSLMRSQNESHLALQRAATPLTFNRAPVPARRVLEQLSSAADSPSHAWVFSARRIAAALAAIACAAGVWYAVQDPPPVISPPPPAVATANSPGAPVSILASLMSEAPSANYTSLASAAVARAESPLASEVELLKRDARRVARVLLISAPDEPADGAVSKTPAVSSAVPAARGSFTPDHTFIPRSPVFGR